MRGRRLRAMYVSAVEALDGTRPARPAWLRGVGGRQCDRAGPPGLADGGPWGWPGETVAVLTVADGPFWYRDGVWADPSIAELVAWRPAAPLDWRLLGGECAVGGPLWLGPWAVEFARWPWLGEAAGPLWLYRAPIDWLRAVGGPREGALLLDAGGMTWRELLAGVPAVVAEDDGHAAEIHGLLRKRRPAPALPTIKVARARAA